MLVLCFTRLVNVKQTFEQREGYVHRKADAVRVQQKLVNIMENIQQHTHTHPYSNRQMCFACVIVKVNFRLNLAIWPVAILMCVGHIVIK